jgi:hypothetical protein
MFRPPVKVGYGLTIPMARGGTNIPTGSTSFIEVACSP